MYNLIWGFYLIGAVAIVPDSADIFLIMHDSPTTNNYVEVELVKIH